MASRPIHFEISADEPERASRFYSDVFGWDIKTWDGPMEYHLVDTGAEGPGINGGIMKRSEGFTGTVNTIGVDSVDRYTELITKKGGTIAMPKMAVPGVGYMAYCKDTEGNIFGIMESDESAA